MAIPTPRPTAIFHPAAQGSAAFVKRLTRSPDERDLNVKKNNTARLEIRCTAWEKEVIRRSAARLGFGKNESAYLRFLINSAAMNLGLQKALEIVAVKYTKRECGADQL